MTISEVAEGISEVAEGISEEAEGGEEAEEVITTTETEVIEIPTSRKEATRIEIMVARVKTTITAVVSKNAENSTTLMVVIKANLAIKTTTEVTVKTQNSEIFQA